MSWRLEPNKQARRASAAIPAAGRINLSLGLTFYCSSACPAAHAVSIPVEGLRTMQRPPARLLASVAVLAALSAGRLLDHDQAVVARHHRLDRDRHRAAHRSPMAAEMDSLGRALPRQSGRPGRRGPLRPGAARGRPARAGRGRARAGRDPQSGQSCRARRLWPRARRQRQLSAGARRAQPRAHARTSPTGASFRCRARCSIRWAATPTRSATTPARCG